MLLEKAPGEMDRFIEELLPSLLNSLSDSADDVVLMNLKVPYATFGYAIECCCNITDGFVERFVEISRVGPASNSTSCPQKSASFPSCNRCLSTAGVCIHAVVLVNLLVYGSRPLYNMQRTYGSCGGTRLPFVVRSPRGFAVD